jgi:hypothetical protein
MLNTTLSRAELRLAASRQHITANRLPGTWQADYAMSEQLGTDNEGGDVSFRIEPERLREIPEKYDTLFKDIPIYACGTVTFKDMGDEARTYLFVLAEFDGHPHVVSFHDSDGVRFGDFTRSVVTIVLGKNEGQDALFLGGYRSKSPYRAFRWAPEVKSATGLRVDGDKENVVASQIEGAWVPDVNVSERLGSKPRGQIAFKTDSSRIQEIPSKFDRFLRGKQIYVCGTMTQDKVDTLFILIEHKGNPHLVYFREQDGDPFGDSESFNVMLARAKDQANDLLFVGGDFNNQPFVAFRRAKPAGE